MHAPDNRGWPCPSTQCSSKRTRLCGRRARRLLNKLPVRGGKVWGWGERLLQAGMGTVEMPPPPFPAGLRGVLQPPLYAPPSWVARRVTLADLGGIGCVGERSARWQQLCAARAWRATNACAAGCPGLGWGG